MPDDCPKRSPEANAGDKARIAELAARQFGLVTRSQLRYGRGQIHRWRAQGYLHAIHPGVYAVGHRPASYEATLAAALLYAGPGAMLSHETAAEWIGVLERRPRGVHVSTPRHARSLPGVVVHDRRPAPRIWLARADPTRRRPRSPAHGAPKLPITPIPRLALDLAVCLDRDALRHALAQLDYRQRLDFDALERVCGLGAPGSPALRAALREHDRRLALARSGLERGFRRLCERYGLPLPEPNEPWRGWVLDAVWWEQRVVVELDGRDNHSSWAQIKRDRRKELELRAAGFIVLRYTSEQIEHDAARVAADVRAALQSRTAAA
jgi:hypothetical protein